MSDTNGARIEQWVETSVAAQRDPVRVPSPSETHRELSLHEALEARARVASLRVKAGERQVGSKVGATSFAIIEQMKGMIRECMMSGMAWSDSEHMKI